MLLRQGGHHVAQNSTNSGFPLSSGCLPRYLSVSVGSGSPALGTTICACKDASVIPVSQAIHRAIAIFFIDNSVIGYIGTLFRSFFSCELTRLKARRCVTRYVAENYLPNCNLILSNRGLYGKLNKATNISNLAGSETERFLRPNRAQKFH